MTVRTYLRQRRNDLLLKCQKYKIVTDFDNVSGGNGYAGRILSIYVDRQSVPMRQMHIG